jgi:septal ring factor EnvC (AmiA/AmiB activator)
LTDGPFAALKGRLRLPVRGEVANRFGAPRMAGGPSWKGVFMRAAAGEEVRAVAAGRVVFSEWMRGLGNLLVLDHGQGYLTIYGNNESVYKTVGDEVRAGDVVAAVGASGGTEESGLYFEIRHEGRASDPMAWVTLR